MINKKMIYKKKASHFVGTHFIENINILLFIPSDG